MARAHQAGILVAPDRDVPRLAPPGEREPFGAAPARDAAEAVLGVAAADHPRRLAVLRAEVSLLRADAPFGGVARASPDEAEAAAGRESMKQDLIGERRRQFFEAYMSKARLKMKIELNREVLDRTIGG